MRQTRLMMGMPITIDVVGATDEGLLARAFEYFDAVDRRFSTYRPDSEIAAINEGRIAPGDCSAEMAEVLALAETTRWETRGFFDVRCQDGSLDPSGIVKGWAIRNVARLLSAAGAENFFVDAGGDIQPSGRNAAGDEWRAGIRNPFVADQIVKTICPRGQGVATSGSYVRGRHIYDPHDPENRLDEVVSLTVIGPDVLEADRFATAAFAMGREGIQFIESQPGLEGYAIDAHGIATMTSGFTALTQF
jgi:thiamine biosynthesis lipoprotein